MQPGELPELCVAHPERQKGEGQALHKGCAVVRICKRGGLRCLVGAGADPD